MKGSLFFYFIFLVSSIVAQIPSAGLVGFYPFNNSTLDSSGMDNHAVAAGCTFVADRFGNAESAFSMDGINDSLIIPIPGYTPLSGDFSISFWMKTNSPEKLNILSLKEYPNDTINNFEIQFSSISSLQTILELYYGFYTYWNGSGWLGNNLAEGNAGQWYNGKWHHHVLRRSNDTLQIWHDREMYYETYFSGTMGDALDFVVSAAPHRYKGLIDDIAFYDRALHPSEIITMYHDHNPFVFITPQNTDAYFQGDTVIVWWKFDTAQLSDSVNLEYRINETGDWLMTEQNHLLEYFNYPFVLSYPPGTKIELRISDRLNPVHSKTVGPFIISPYQWQLVSDSLPFTYRDGSGLLNFKGKMWLLGGWDPPYHEPNYTCSEIYSSTDGILWEYHGEAPWPARHISGWLVHDSAMYLIGGDPQSGSLTDVWKSDDGINWIQLHDSIPGVYPWRNSHMVGSVGENILYFGGQPAAYVSENLNEVWRSSDGFLWEQLPDAPWLPRGMVLNSCVSDMDTLWLLGGGRVWDRRCYNDVWKTGDGINWELVNEAAPWAPRYWHTVGWFDNKMWVLCGVVNQTNNAEAWYSSDGITWWELKYPPYIDRHAAATTVFDNALWLMTGIGTNDSWKLVNTEPPIVQNISENNLEVNVYPNPATTYIIIETENIYTKTISISDVSGRIMQKFVSMESIITIQLKNFDAGIYFIKMNDGVNTVVRKFMKE